MRSVRRVIAGSAGLVVLLGCGTPVPEVPVEHGRGAASNPDASNVGPDIGILSEDWQVDPLPVGDGSLNLLEFQTAGGNLIVTTGERVMAFDLESGEQTWHYREPGRTLASGVADDAVVIATEFSDNPDANRLLSLDASTGELLWERANEWRVGISGPQLNVAAGVIPLLEADRHRAREVFGLDARTGEIDWTTSFDRCGIAHLDPVSSSDGSLVLKRDGCAADSRWQAFDPETGEELWSQTWGIGASVSPSRVLLHDGTTVIRFEGEALLIDREGTERSQPLEDGWTESVGPYITTRHGDDDSAARGALFDVRTGEYLAEDWPRLISGRVPHLDANGIMYAFDPHQRVPTMVVGDPTGDAPTYLPLPGLDHSHEQVIWAGTGADRLLLARQIPPDGPIRLFAYTSEPTDGPVELGGVAFEDWPDPCDLVEPELGYVDGATGDTERERTGTATVGSTSFPTVRCRVYFDNPDYDFDEDYADVEILWVGAEPEHVAGWLGGTPGPRWVDEIRDDEYETNLVARVGRVLVQISSYGDHVDSMELLDAMVVRLANH